MKNSISIGLGSGGGKKRWEQLTPYFALPTNGVSLIVGQEVTIYGDSLIAVPIVNNLKVTYTCDIGTVSGNNITFDCVSGDIGVHTLTMSFWNGKFLGTHTINLEVIALAPAGSVKILEIGDSTLSGDIEYIGSEIESILSNNSFTYIGTQGVTRKNEGYPGWSMWSFVDNNLSPFRKNNIIDIPAYLSDNSLATPELLYFRMGINDFFDLCATYVVQENIDQFIGRFNTLITAFWGVDNTIKVIIAIPTVCSNSAAKWAANEYPANYSQNKFIEIMHEVWTNMVTYYNNGAYDDRVSLSYEAVNINRSTAYSDSVHFNNEIGNIQLGDGLVPYFNTMFINKIIPSGLTLTLISGGVQIDWTDNSGGVLQHEIWGKSDTENYALLYTIDAGTVTKDDLLNAVDLRYYKIRGKSGDYFTAFTDEKSIAMVGAELCVNGNFSAWTGDNPDGWTILDTDTFGVSESSGKCRIKSVDGVVRISQEILAMGFTYRVKMSIDSNTGDGIYVKLYDTLLNTVITTGEKIFYGVATGGEIFTITRVNQTDIIFDNVSVKRVINP